MCYAICRSLTLVLYVGRGNRENPWCITKIKTHHTLSHKAGKARGGAVSHKETLLVVISFSDPGNKHHARADRKQRDRLKAIAIQEGGGVQLSGDDKGFSADVERYKRV